MRSVEQLAELHSASCFLNSLFLEWPHCEQVALPTKLKQQGTSAVSFKLVDKTYLLPVHHFSQVGRHQYTGSFYQVAGVEQFQQVSFAELAQQLVAYLAQTMSITAQDQKNFLARLANSREHIQLALEVRNNDPVWQQSQMSFKQAEQALLIGHNLHPTPKSRSEFGRQDFLIISPETAGSFHLSWMLVHADVFYSNHAEGFTDHQWLRDIFISEQQPNDEVKQLMQAGYSPLPVHPWQKGHILKHTAVSQYIQSKKVLLIKDGQTPWHPTSSVRSLYRVDAPYMIKVSLNARLTNSLRNLLVHEVVRGLQVYEVFQSDVGRDFGKKHPYFQVMQEPVFVAIKDQAGNPIEETIIIARENPYYKTINDHAVVLATLTQQRLYDETALLERYLEKVSPQKWFEHFLQVAILPLIDAQANYGILLGAHQQNLIIDIKDCLPVGAKFRDCHGTGYSPLGHQLLSSHVKSLDPHNGNILPEQAANYLFGYYLIINSVFSTITALAVTKKVSEGALLNQFRQELEKFLVAGVKDPSFINYLLTQDQLQHKGNFFCTLRSINENTQANPLDIYTKIPNPLKTSQGHPHA